MPADASRASGEPYVTSFEATVDSVDGRTVTLEHTYFYAEGGGQPADRGTLDGVDVADVQSLDGETVHTLASAPDFAAGDTVTGAIDESFRTYSMRAHTASHIVYGAGRRLFDGHGYGGFDIGEETVRLDFETAASAERVDPLTVQEMVNEVVWEDRAVDWYEMGVEAARDHEDIVFNLGDTTPTESVRIVEIADWDISACGGTHVASTVEVGPIKVLDVSNPGADLVRVEYAVGPAAIERQVAETRSARRGADALDTSVEGLGERAEGLLDEKKALQEECARLRGDLLDARLSALASETHTRDGREWLVGTVEGVDSNAVADHLRTRDGAADVVVLTGTDGATFVVVGTDGETDANDVIGEITDEFGGGGGGQPTLAQGGGLSAEPEAVVDYLTD
ncbi:alanyl-tRNA editing protein [Haloarcula halophila]|uniref:alanyl-tRNA editing protein n=1 Tax=Haloarcula TaxID=2237 RepID=UPI0023E3D6FF|nr:DHHA1 domain-containing protein [Halomicroarcula sp. DFY41]